MYELIKITEKTFYIQCPAKIGVIKTGENEVCFIDSGNDKDAGKKALKLSDANGWTLNAVYNTHSHADHIGGNQYLQRQTGCKIYACGIERDFTEHPVLEPSFLYGANPPVELRHKFLMAQGCEVLPLTQNDLPDGIELIPLPGHTWDMVGFRTPDGVVFLADCLSSKETLEKYQITFLTDVGKYLETIESVRGLGAEVFVPSHAEPTQDIVPLARLNSEKVYEIAEAITEICREPASFEELLKRLFYRYQLVISFEQHALVGSTLRSYLTWLKEQGSIRAFFEDNVLLWEARS